MTAARRTADMANRFVGRVLRLACPSFEGEACRQDESVVAGPPAIWTEAVPTGSESAGQPRQLKGNVKRISASRTVISSTSTGGGSMLSVE